MQEIIVIGVLAIAVGAFCLLTGCAILPLVEEIKRKRIKRDSERYTRRHGL